MKQVSPFSLRTHVSRERTDVHIPLLFTSAEASKTPLQAAHLPAHFCGVTGISLPLASHHFLTSLSREQGGGFDPGSAPFPAHLGTARTPHREVPSVGRLLSTAGQANKYKGTYSPVYIFIAGRGNFTLIDKQEFARVTKPSRTF